MRALAIAIALTVLLPVSAGAHGEGGGHGDHGAAQPPGNALTVTIGDYQVELLSHPSPLARGQASDVTARILEGSARRAVSGATVLIGAAPPGSPSELRPAAEKTWAGSYAVAVTPAGTGRHQIRVVLAAVDGRALAPPLAVDFQVEVARSPGLAATTWTLLGLVAAIAAVGVWSVAVRAGRVRDAAAAGLNLLDVAWIRRVLTSRAFQPALQVPILGLMGVVVYVGFQDVQNGGMNLATKLTWTIWWAGIIFTFFLVGRVWCLACPFGALNEWTSRLAAPLRRLPRPFRNIWWATAMFVLLTWADEQLGVVRSPRVTAWIVVFFAAVAVAVGLAFERRSFCRYLCPIGGLIGIYSMTAPLELRARDRAVCLAHREKECYRGTAGARGCPMFEFPQTMDRNNYCTLCAECVKGCSRDNLALRVRAFGQDLWASGRRALDESYLAVVLVGLTLIVTAEMLGAWPDWVSALARWLPTWVRASLKPVAYLGLVESAILLGGSLVIVPLLVLSATALADRLAGGQGVGLRRAFVVFGYAFVPIGLAMHLAHNLAHLLLEGGGIVPVVQRAVAVHTPFSLGDPDWRVAPLASADVVGLLQMAVLVGFFVLSLVAGHRLSLRAYSDPRAASRAFVPLAFLAFVFTVAGIVLLNQPMGMRHGM